MADWASSAAWRVATVCDQSPPSATPPRGGVGRQTEVGGRRVVLLDLEVVVELDVAPARVGGHLVEARLQAGQLELAVVVGGHVLGVVLLGLGPEEDARAGDGLAGRGVD